MRALWLPRTRSCSPGHSARSSTRRLHALARAVYHGQRGRISAREVYDQMNACSCLTLILACIIYWQAKQLRLSPLADRDHAVADCALWTRGKLLAARA